MFKLNNEECKLEKPCLFSSLLLESKIFSFDELVSTENTN